MTPVEISAIRAERNRQSSGRPSRTSISKPGMVTDVSFETSALRNMNRLATRKPRRPVSINCNPRNTEAIVSAVTMGS